MKEPLSIYNSILFLNLKPWLAANNSEKKFDELLNDKIRAAKNSPQQFFISLAAVIKKHGFTFDIPAYTIPVKSDPLTDYTNELKQFDVLTQKEYYNKITEFYLYLIINERLRILHELMLNVKSSKNSTNANYKVKVVLKELVQMIKDTASINKSDKQSVYVLNTLKLSLVRLNEEIRFIYPAVSDKMPFTIFEALEYIAPDYEAEKSNSAKIAHTIYNYLAIKDKTTANVQTLQTMQSSQESTKSDKPAFIPKQLDFRTGYKGKLSYEDIVNIALFTKVEENLYYNNFIDLDYKFTNKHNKKKELAAIFKILIQKRYFKESNYKHGGKFKNSDYRQYLDHRYNVDTSQQFRKNTSEYIQTVSDQNYWLDHLQSC